MRKLKSYKVTFDSEVFAISLVKEPAIEVDFVYLSKEKEDFIYLESDDKHLVIGAVLRPNYPIYRNQGGEEFYLTFESDVIEHLAHSYLQNDHIYSFTEQHKSIADGVSLVESWIKTSENDKSVDYGFKDTPIGTWFVAAKIENEDLWQGIKNGEMKGFSVESFVSLDEIKLSKEKEEINMFDETFWEKIKAIITDALKSPSTPQTEAEQTAEMVVADMIEETAEETPIVEEPQIEETVETVEETPIEEEIVEPTEIVEEVAEEVVEESETVEEAENNLQEIIDALNAKISELNSEIEKLKNENVKLSKQPSAKPINAHMSSESKHSGMDRVRAFYDTLK